MSKKAKKQVVSCQLSVMIHLISLDISIPKSLALLYLQWDSLVMYVLNTCCETDVKN